MLFSSFPSQSQSVPAQAKKAKIGAFRQSREEWSSRAQNGGPAFTFAHFSIFQLSICLPFHVPPRADTQSKTGLAGCWPGQPPTFWLFGSFTVRSFLAQLLAGFSAADTSMCHVPFIGLPIFSSKCVLPSTFHSSFSSSISKIGCLEGARFVVWRSKTNRVPTNQIKRSKANCCCLVGCAAATALWSFREKIPSKNSKFLKNGKMYFLPVFVSSFHP
jgi:hypothetical protein